MTTPIRDTGIRGFLKWFQQQQPALYKKIAPQLPKAAPAAFSGYMPGGWRVAGLSRDDAVAKLQRMGLGQFDTDDGSGGIDTLPEVTVTGVYTDTSGLDSGINLDTGYTNTDTCTYGATYTPVAVDTSTAANSGPASSSTANAIAAVVSAGSKAYLTVEQQNVQNQIVQTQLQRAAAGLPPLPTSVNSLGIPSISTGSTLDSGGMLLLLGGGLLLAAVLGGTKKKAA